MTMIAAEEKAKASRREVSCVFPLSVVSFSLVFPGVFLLFILIVLEYVIPRLICAGCYKS